MQTMAKKYSVEEFVNNTNPKGGNEFFEQESDRIMAINLSDNLAWMKKGAMIAYTGDVKFTMESLFEHGVGNFVKNLITQEKGSLVKAEGKGKVYIADSGKKISILNMQNESLIVDGNNLLAFEPSLKWETKLQKLTAMMAGGLTNIKIEGSGMVAISTYYDPLTLRVTPGNPVMTDPTATVAWSGNLQPTFKADMNLKTLIGRGSGDTVQMKFEGDGFVIVQPDCYSYNGVVTASE